MERRELGKTGIFLSVVGFGGIVVMNEEQENANRLVARAVERGINYFDVAPSYGNAEERLGPALEPYRHSVFLACKTEQRTGPEALAQLHKSLARLRTEYLDLYQLHGITTLEEVETLSGPGGALEALVQARDKGLVRRLGFSAHSEKAALALMERFDFDTVLYPFNWACWLGEGLGKSLLEKASQQKMGILAIKALAKRQWREGEKRRWPKCWYSPVDSYDEARMALRFTLSKPITAAIAPGHAELLWWACDAADELAPLSAEEEDKLKTLCAGIEPVFQHED